MARAADWVRRAVGVLAGLAIGSAAWAGDEISAAENAVFVAEHLAGLPARAELHYRYQLRRADAGAVDDRVTLVVQEAGERGRVVTADFLHGDRHLTLPEVERATANPVILYFLEHDVRSMHRELGGMENYFRRRIRLALASGAEVVPVEIEYRGVKRVGTRVEVKPYADDPLRDRFKGMEGKRYAITLSDAVPGGVYELRTSVDGASPRDPPRFEEVLTLEDERS